MTGSPTLGGDSSVGNGGDTGTQYTSLMVKILNDYEHERRMSTEAHARHLLRKQWKNSKLPRVADVQRALQPVECDDCHQTYWRVVDSWRDHYPCPGEQFKDKAGF